MTTEAYIESSLPSQQVAELHRLMTEEVKEVAVFFMDPDGIITVWNRAAEDMKGYTAEEAIGSHLEILYTHEDRARGWAQHNLAKARDEGFYREETWRRRKDGSLFWARIALTGLRDAEGRLVGFSKITVDLTDHKQLERCVKEREETRRVLRAANAGLWSWDSKIERIDVCANFLALLGYPGSDTSMSPVTWLSFVDPDQRDQVARRFDEVRQAGPGTPFSVELRMCRQDGSCGWYHLHADWHQENENDAPVLSGVLVDIDELKRTGDELRGAMTKLQAEDRRKDEFLAMLAHELRNPLAPIRSAAEMLKVARLSQERVQKTSQVIARQVNHMTSLIDDLLDVSRVTRGLVSLERTPLDLNRLLTDAAEQVNPLIGSKQHALVLHLSSHPAIVMGDEKRLVQVVTNLLNNAAKYTPPGGQLGLSTEISGDRVLLRVRDNGIGMRPDLVGRVFDLFAQAERTPDRSTGGLGIGLALAKSLVELHGGELRAESAGLGAGSTFSVSLPLLDHQAPGEAATPPTDAGRGLPRSVRIMVVDDNVDAAEMIAMYLEEMGHEVAVEHTAARTLLLATSWGAQVYLLDIGLPEIDGYELVRRLRAMPETQGAVFIALTGYGHDSDRQRALAAGFHHHLVKPADPQKLAALLASLHG
ncbi:MAG: putative histidine kinase, hybrid [Rhodoferax sp.]|nr:putative histidine kinase, hybrid [Rhodoferax sp.]